LRVWRRVAAPLRPESKWPAFAGHSSCNEAQLLGIDNLCQLRLHGRRNLGNLTFVRQNFLRRGQSQRVLQARNVLSVLFRQPVLYALVPIGKALTRRLCYLTALRNLTNNMA
jgi:hypothetical protein